MWRNQKNQAHRAECGDIHCADAEQHGSHTPAYKVSTEQADGQADACEDEALLYNVTDHAIAAGTEGHAQGNLLRSLRYRECHPARVASLPLRRVFGIGELS